MSNLKKIPQQDWYKSNLSQEWDWETWTMFLQNVPTFTMPAWETCYVVVQPNWANAKLAEFDSINVWNNTINITSVTLLKGASIDNPTWVTYPTNTEVLISDNYQFWKDIQTAIETKLNLDETSTVADTIKIQFGSSAAYIYTDDNWVNLKFKDWNNAEATLSDILAAAGIDRKVAISDNDTTPWQLDDKITPWDWIDTSILNPAWNEELQIAIDLITTNWLKITTGQLDIEPATNTQVWTQRIATDAEATAWTLEDVSINPKQAKDNYWPTAWFIVNKDDTQLIDATTETTIVWQVEISDDDWVFASNQFTTPSDWLYQFNCSLSTSWSEAWFELKFTNWSGTVYENNAFNSVEQIGFVSASTVISLSQNDIVEIRIETISSSTVTIVWTTFSWFKI